MLIEGEYPEELQTKWSWGAYEMRYARPALVLHGRHPMWVTGAFLHDATFNDGRLYCGDADFSSLYVDVGILMDNLLMPFTALLKTDCPWLLFRRHGARAPAFP